jgi:hypothetical protein
LIKAQAILIEVSYTVVLTPSSTTSSPKLFYLSESADSVVVVKMTLMMGERIDVLVTVLASQVEEGHTHQSLILQLNIATVVLYRPNIAVFLTTDVNPSIWFFRRVRKPGAVYFHA